MYIYLISSIPAHPQIRRMKLQLDKEPPGTTWKYLESLVEKGWERDHFAQKGRDTIEHNRTRSAKTKPVWGSIGDFKSPPNKKFSLSKGLIDINRLFLELIDLTDPKAKSQCRVGAPSGWARMIPMGVDVNVKGFDPFKFSLLMFVDVFVVSVELAEHSLFVTGTQILW